MSFSVDTSKDIVNEITTVEDRTEKNKSLTLGSYFPTFFSVLLPELGRPQYVVKCVDHLIKHCDMPIEIILHDDGSSREKQQILFNELREKISIMVLNTSHNIGLSGAMNRCRKMASSKYLFGMNVDDYPTSSFLRRMRTALDLPYVGIVNVIPKINGKKGDRGLYIAPDGTKITLTKNIGHFLLFGMRTDVWDEAGGWDERVQTTASDVGFGGVIFGNGYFTVDIEGTYYNEQWNTRETENGLINDKGTNEDYIASARFTRGDNNCPKFPNFDYALHSELCVKRQEDIWHGVNDDVQAYAAKGKIFPTWYNSAFCAQEKSKLYIKEKLIDWEFAKVYGHDKWKEQVIKDFNLE